MGGLPNLTPASSRDYPVCPKCGKRVGAEPSCLTCHDDLTRYEKLPLRQDWLAGRALRASDTPDAAEEAQEPEVRFELNPAAAALALLGAAMCVLGLFLPTYENPGFSSIAKNTMIQQGAVVWTVVIFGALFAVDLFRAYQSKRPPRWAELVFPVTVGLSTARLLKGTTLYPVVGGAADTTASGLHAAAGAGVYVTFAGAVICALGIVAMRQWPGRELRQCPACAETVLAQAHVCKHCGQRLDAPPLDANR
jgi:hypothetical protein